MTRSRLPLRVAKVCEIMDDSGKSLLIDKDGLQIRLFRNKVKQAGFSPADICEGAIVVLTAKPDRNGRPWRAVEVHAVLTEEELPDQAESTLRSGQEIMACLLYVSRLEGRGMALTRSLDLIELDVSMFNEEQFRSLQTGSTVSLTVVLLDEQYVGLKVALVPD